MARKNTQNSVTTATANDEAKKHNAAVDAAIAHENAKAAFKAEKADKRNAFLQRAMDAGKQAGNGSSALVDLALDFQLDILTGGGLGKSDAKDIYLAYADGYNAAPKSDKLATDDKSIKSQVSTFATFALPAALHIVGSQHRVDTGREDDQGNAITVSVYDAIIAMVKTYGTKALAGGIYKCMAKVNREANKLLSGSESDKAKASMLQVIDADWILRTIEKDGGKSKTDLQKYDSWLKSGETLYEKTLSGYNATMKMATIINAISALRGELAAEIERMRADIEAENAIANEPSDDEVDDDASDMDEAA